MAMTFHCDIVSAEGEIFSGQIESVIAHGELGDLGINFGHAPLITSLKPGPITLTKLGGEREVFYISGGFLEVQPNMVKVLADTVQRAADLDEASAQEAVKAAEKALNEKGADFDYGSAAARLAEAAAQLRTVQQIRKKFGG
ncbi:MULTISPECIES: F0F1 ATP synthase subunit epsilon [Pseudomonas]|jgi:F-type H+-transporting ATPase subunit epsilon|uniref:ATP synthase epsilon chain n=1 Tax=Pseudomonas yamanorum TaxID=515393 RepID=A0A145XLX3_9PSED|nr:MULTISPECIES: F0F1 ATP synthase subunit epsilon [Pseudomonas]MDP9060216.1 F0F1 ATP synthase subunit epsilon [Pseudomonadota bacterium]AMW86749.1 ATP synthase epsilon chain [Pseudomonas yamanorum]AUO26455.1 F0F1 ATP synthase subunit epsilon [Pseudomonas sp. NC02]EJF67753.1 F0F1 ATP synthase subunit epsilon [Pseudomonas sp. Ag1]MBK5409145.1 F0F1 ATP synthase subunit epsilon [Pseudomonas sp. TH34]|eukprot:gene19801-30496_t